VGRCGACFGDRGRSPRDENLIVVVHVGDAHEIFVCLKVDLVDVACRRSGLQTKWLAASCCVLDTLTEILDMVIDGPRYTRFI
jgi:hypothetical protein